MMSPVRQGSLSSPSHTQRAADYCGCRPRCRGDSQGSGESQQPEGQPVPSTSGDFVPSDSPPRRGVKAHRCGADELDLLGEQGLSVKFRNCAIEKHPCLLPWAPSRNRQGDRTPGPTPRIKPRSSVPAILIELRVPVVRFLPRAPLQGKTRLPNPRTS